MKAPFKYMHFLCLSLFLKDSAATVQPSSACQGLLLKRLCGIFTKLLNISLSHATIPPCLKTATIIPIPQKTGSEGLNSYRLVALRVLREAGVTAYTSQPFSLSWPTSVHVLTKQIHRRCHFYCSACCFGNTASDKKTLRVIKTAQKIIGRPLPSLDDITSSRYHRRATRITHTICLNCCHEADFTDP